LYTQAIPYLYVSRPGAAPALPHAEQAIRQDITGQDVILLMSGIHQTASPLLETQPQLWRRCLHLVFDGMQAGTRTEPATPTTTG
jgi:hypothetical protein